MKQKSIVIAAVLAVTILTAVFTTPPFSMKDAEGQTLPSCPVGYERNILGTCEPITRPPTDTLPTSENRIEENIVCSGLSYTCG